MAVIECTAYHCIDTQHSMHDCLEYMIRKSGPVILGTTGYKKAFSACVLHKHATNRHVFFLPIERGMLHRDKKSNDSSPRARPIGPDLTTGVKTRKDPAARRDVWGTLKSSAVDLVRAPEASRRCARGAVPPYRYLYATVRAWPQGT